MTKKAFVQLFFSSFVFLAIIIGSVYVNFPGILHPEAEQRIPRYLDNRPILPKIFDVNVNDSTWYQAREIGYIFEITDVYFIHWSARLGFPHFLSASNYLSILFLSILTVFIGFAYFKQRHPAIPLLLGVIFLTTPAAFLGVFFYRSSKEMLSLMLATLILLFLRFLKQGKNESRQMLFIFITSFVAALFDRQGFYIVTFFSSLFFLVFLYTRKKHHLRLFLILLAASLSNCLYNFVVGPMLIHQFAGYWPDFSYQLGLGNPSTNTAVANFFAVFTWPQLIRAVKYSLQTFSFLLGNIPLYLLIPLLLFFCYFLYVSLSRKFEEKRKMNKGFFVVCIIIFSVTAMVLLNSVMLVRHTGMMLPDVVRLYYMLPAYTLCIIVANYVLADQWVDRKSNTMIVTIVLLSISLLNIAALPSHNGIIRNGIFIQKYVTVTPNTVNCIKHKERAIGEVNLPWIQNKILCEALRK